MKYNVRHIKFYLNLCIAIYFHTVRCSLLNFVFTFSLCLISSWILTYYHVFFNTQIHIWVFFLTNIFSAFVIKAGEKESILFFQLHFNMFIYVQNQCTFLFINRTMPTFKYILVTWEKQLNIIYNLRKMQCFKAV